MKEGKCEVQKRGKGSGSGVKTRAITLFVLGGRLKTEDCLRGLLQE